MAKEFFKDLPDTTTPITAGRLNGLLDGEEPMGDLVVDSIRTKNLFDKNSMVYSDRGYLPGDISNTQIRDYGGSGTYILIIKLEEGKTYTISKRAGGRFSAGFTNTQRPALNTNNVITSRLNNNDTGTLMTFTVPTGSPYFVCNYYSADQTADTNVGYDNIVNSIQIEKGSTPTTYSPYQNLDGYDNYSIDEIKIGTWINGKPIYRKTILRTDAITANTEHVIDMNISNIDIITNISGVLSSSNKQAYRQINTYNLPNTNSSISMVAQKDGLVRIYANENWGSPNIIITLEYTKTTD